MRTKVRFCELEIGEKFISNSTLFIRVATFFASGGPYNAISNKPASYNFPTFFTDKEEVEKL